MKISSTLLHRKHFICRNIIYGRITWNKTHGHMKETYLFYLIQLVINGYIFDFCCIAQYTFLLYAYKFSFKNMNMCLCKFRLVRVGICENTSRLPQGRLSPSETTSNSNLHYQSIPLSINSTNSLTAFCVALSVHDFVICIIFFTEYLGNNKERIFSRYSIHS